jgi:protein-L-isoaspartate(D-aspartate) O-methyltransferase
MEIVESLAREADARLGAQGWRGCRIRHADGYAGWPAMAPFDAIVLAAAPETFPPALTEQLADGGRLIGPVGPADAQMLVRIARHGNRLNREPIFPVRFVPMTGLSKSVARSNS